MSFIQIQTGSNIYISNRTLTQRDTLTQPCEDKWTNIGDTASHFRVSHNIARRCRIAVAAVSIVATLYSRSTGPFTCSSDLVVAGNKGGNITVGSVCVAALAVETSIVLKILSWVAFPTACVCA